MRCSGSPVGSRLRVREGGSIASRRSPATVLLTAAVMAVVASPTAAQRQFDELGKRALPPDWHNTKATVFGDVDGDGDLDLIVGNSTVYDNDGQNRLYLNDGDGTFTDVTVSHMPLYEDDTTSLVLGDVDGDGDLDLVVGNTGADPYAGQCALYLNDGTGHFTDVTATNLPVARNYSTSLALGDVDGDGDLDLVIGNTGAYHVQGGQTRLLFNNGRGAFGDVTATRLPVGTFDTTSLALGDIDGDGDLDLVLGNQGPYGAQSRAWRNDGTGSFTDATGALMPTRSEITFALAFGDVDGDGDLDLVMGNSGQSRLYLNDGTGRFTDGTALRLPHVGLGTTALTLGDLDGDGDLDLVIGNAYGLPDRSRLYRNDGLGNFTDATVARLPAGLDLACALALGDVDGDGDLDLLIGNGQEARPNRLCLNDGNGAFTDATARRLPIHDDRFPVLALGDVDGDGDLDLIVSNSQYQDSRPYLNDGSGTFVDAPNLPIRSGRDAITSLALGDVDGDGDLDVLVGIGSIGTPRQSRLLLNNGSGAFGDVTVARMPVASYFTTSLALGDVDGDGDLDLVLGNSDPTGAPSRLYLNDGRGTFTDVTATRMPAGGHDTWSVVLGDVDGDGDLDLVLGNGSQRGEQSLLYLNDGTGTFTDATVSRMPVGIDDTRVLALGDLDGDGDLDLLLANDSDPGRLCLNDGAGRFVDFTSTHIGRFGVGVAALALGDVDLDGDLDLLQVSGGSVSLLYLNDGSGTFTLAPSSRMPDSGRYGTAMVLGDVDGDGDLDMVVGNTGFAEWGHSRVEFNLLRQLDAPHVLRVGRNHRLDVYSRYDPASVTAIAFPFLSAGTAHIPFPPLGTIGIDLNTIIALPPLTIPQPAGVSSLTVGVPNQPALAGATIWAQAAIDQRPVQVRLTNVVSDTVLR